MLKTSTACILFCLLGLSLVSTLTAADELKRSFDVPAGSAVDTLKAFASQADRQLLYSADTVASVMTNAVKGQYTSRDALAAMLSGTALKAVVDETSGALSIIRRTSPTSTVGGPSPADRAMAETGHDEVVKMGTFEVSTTLGNYAESSASTGSKIPMEMIEQPSTTQVLNASFLEDRNAQSLDDVYNYVLGMARTNGGATDFTLRGFSSHGAGLNLHNMETDGLPGLTTRFGSPNTANIERVEILKGPASMLYGLVTPGGMVNLVTKQPQQTYQATISGSVSTYDGFDSSFGKKMSYSGTVDVTGPLDSGQHWLYRLIVRDDDLDSFRENNFGQNQYVYPSLTYVWDQNTSLSIQLELLSQKRLADYTGLPVPFGNLAYLPPYDTNYNDPTDIERDRGQALTAGFRHLFDNGWLLRASARSSNNDNGRRQLDFSSLKSVLPAQNSTLVRTFRDFAGNNNRVNFVDVNAYGNVGPKWFTNTILVGASFDQDLVGLTGLAKGPTVPAITIYTDPASIPYPPDGAGQSKTRAKYNMVSGYFSDHIKVSDHLLPSFGVRYDHQDGTTSDLIAGTKAAKDTGALVPNAGLVYLFSEKLSAYASYSASFFPNSLTAYNANNQQGLDPQTATQVEVGTKADWLNGTLNTTFAFYDIRMKNVLEATPNFTPQGNPISILDGVQESKGVELETTWLVVPNWQVTAGISYLNAMVIKSDTPSLVNTRLTGVPRTTGNFWTRYNIPDGFLKGFGAGVGVTYEGQYPVSIAGVTIPGHTLVDAALYYRLHRYKLALNLENALDAKYIASLSQDNSGLWPGSPRQLTFSVQVPF